VVASTTFAPLAPAELVAWLRDLLVRYIDERVTAGDSRAGAEAAAHASLEHLFPDGAPAPGQLVGHLVSSTTALGSLWIGMAGTDPERWWVGDVMIDEDFCGESYGREAKLLADELARKEGPRRPG
jgi:hypothetical protein